MLFISFNLLDKFKINNYIVINMFEFFKFGFIPGVFHLLFMGTLPLAILLVLGGSYVLAAVTFFIGAPLFRSIRNNSLGF